MSKLEAGRSVVVLGPSGSGKSTLVNAVRGPGFADQLTIPRRVITLPIREDSDPAENSNVDHVDFVQKMASGSIGTFWTRQLGNQLMHFYGFETVDRDDERTVLYPANNAMALSGLSHGVRDLLERSDIVLVTADREERERRLLERAPSMPADERAARLDDEIDFLFLGGNNEIRLIDTGAMSIDESRERFMDFVLGEAAALPSIAPSVETQLPRAA